MPQLTGTVDEIPASPPGEVARHAAGTSAPPKKKFKSDSKGRITNMTKDDLKSLSNAIENQARKVQHLTAMRNELESDHGKLQKNFDDLEDKIQEKDSSIEDLAKQVNAAKKETQELEHQNAMLQKALEEACLALKDSGKHCKREEKESINEAIKKWVNQNGHLKTKFVKDAAFKRFATKVHNGIKDSLGLEEEGTDHCTPLVEFLRIYENQTQLCLQKRRQHTQTQLREATMSEFNGPLRTNGRMNGIRFLLLALSCWHSCFFLGTRFVFCWRGFAFVQSLWFWIEVCIMLRASYT